MMAHRFVKTPQRSCRAVIFSSQRNDGRAAEYAQAAASAFEPAVQQRGWRGAGCVRDAAELGITVAYFDRADHILRLRKHGEHAQIRARGRGDWYAHVEVRAAEVERVHGARGELLGADSAASGIGCR